jgi:transcription initiation factor TFIIIB Brf1 subunit/transcription initiation factor TFIIB
LYVPNSGPNKPQIERVSKKRKTSGKNWDPNLVYLQMIAFDCNWVPHIYFGDQLRHWKRIITLIIIQKEEDPATNICSICKRTDKVISDPESGEIICSNCGVVISDKIQDINRLDRRAFSPEELNNRIRTGSAASLARYDMGLATTIGKADRDAKGHRLDPIMRDRMQRLRRWNIRTLDHTSAYRNLMLAFSELAIVKDKLGLSDAIVEKTAYIYRKAQERMLVRGRTISGTLAAANNNKSR